MDDNREMFEEVNALVGAIAKAFSLSDEDTVKAIEAGSVSIVMAEDEQGQRFLNVTHAGRSAQIYPGAIHHAPEKEEPAEQTTGGCGTGGCGCGH